MSGTTLSPAQFQQVLARFLWMLDDTLYRFENAGDLTAAEDVLIHGHELMELAWDLANTVEPWVEYAPPGRPGFVLLENHDPVTGFSMDFTTEGRPVPVCLASVVLNTEPAERERFIKLLRLWKNYIVGLQADGDGSSVAQTEPSIAGFVPAATLALDHTIIPQRLSEAAADGNVRTMQAPSGMKDSEGKRVRKLYNTADALKHCKPKWTKKKNATKSRSTNS